MTEEKIKVLLVEDHPAAGRGIKDALSNKADVTLVTTYDEAKALLLSQKFDALITDNRFPKSQEDQDIEDRGIRLIEALRKSSSRNKDIPVLFQSLDAGASTVQLAQQAGADMVIGKDEVNRYAEFVDNVIAGKYQRNITPGAEGRPL